MLPRAPRRARGGQRARPSNPAEAAANAELWLQDEPFQASAALIASSIYSSIVLDYEAGIRVVDKAIAASPNNAMLINNKIVCLAKAGKLIEANLLLEKLGPLKRGDELSPFYFAAHGLVAYRSGNFDIGDQFYGHAVEAALERKDQNRVFLAYISWWEQVALSGSLSLESVRETGSHLEAIWKSNAKLQRDYNLLWPALRERAYARVNSAEIESLSGAMLSSHGLTMAANIGNWTDSLMKIPLDVKKGDAVLFGKWSDTEVKIDGDELLIMNESKTDDSWSESSLADVDLDSLDDENETKLLLQYHNP